MAKHRLVYPGHQFAPEDLLNFIELDWFTRSWKELGLDDEKALAALQILIMCDPHSAPVIRGAGGLRKMRYAPPGWEIGKRGALRVCYAYFEKYGIVLLVAVYAKGEKDNLSPAGKATIRKALERIERSLEDRFGF